MVWSIPSAHGLKRANPSQWVAATLLACLLLAGCNDYTAPPAYPKVTASLGSCPVQRVDDSGAILYVVVSPSCDSTQLAGSITVEANGESFTTNTYFDGYDQTQTMALPVIGPRDVTVFKSGSWRRIANDSSWAGRDGAGLLVKNGRLYLLGGWTYGPVTSEVWTSTDAVHWEFLGNGPWEGRHGSAWLVHDDRLYVIGGDLLTDVWSSADGIDWRLENANAPFGKRYTPNAVSLDGKIIVYGGLYWDPVDWCHDRDDCSAVGRNDVWQSADGGVTWSLLTAAAPWEGRGLIHGSVVYGNRMVLIGGGLKVAPPGARYQETSREFSDIWSSADGISWRQETADFGFAPRTHFSVAASEWGCIVSDGSVGTQTNVSNDLLFAPDCVHFTAVPDPPLERRHASSLAVFNGSVVILGGPPSGGAATTVWQYFP